MRHRMFLVALLVAAAADRARADDVPAPSTAPAAPTDTEADDATPAAAAPADGTQATNAPAPATGATTNAPADAMAKQTKQRKPRPPQLPCRLVPVDLAVWNNISINALYRPACARNYFGLALGQGGAGELRGLELGVVAYGTERSMYGAQIAGLVVASGEDGAGLQLAGLVAASGSNFTGVQLAALVGAAGSDFTGFQLSGVAAAGGGTRAIQLGVLGSASGESSLGVQVGGLFAAAGEAFRGLQVSGLVAASGAGLSGLQVGGLVAAAGDDVRGLQVAGLLAAAGTLEGIQIAGGGSYSGGGTGAQIATGVTRALGPLSGAQIAIVNIGRGITGAQIGLVNIAREVHGLQLGLVNVADRATAPIGLVSWMRDGERAIEVWGGEAVPFAAAARFGTDRVYSLVGVTADPLHADASWGPVGGFGARSPIGPIALHTDAIAHALLFDGFHQPALLAQGRVRIAVPVTDRVAAFAGVTWNVFVSDDVDGASLPLGLDRVHRDGDLVTRQWPGFVAGAALRY